MNRLECLQSRPMQYRKVFYLGAPTVFILFTITMLMSCLGMSFEEAKSFWYLPALGGGIVGWYIFQNILSPKTPQGVTENIEVNAAMLREELEKTNRCIKPLVQACIVILAVALVLRPPFYLEIAQLMDIAAMISFFILGSYFRQVLHVYSRTPDISDKEVSERYAERSLFQILGWLALFFFFSKTIGLKGKMGSSWSRLPEIQLPNVLLVIALGLYFLGILGTVFQVYFDKKTNKSYKGLFEAFIAFGSLFPIVWLYPYLHPYLFLDLPAWIIQLPLLMLLVVNSVGMLLSFENTLQKKILGNTCLWFVKHGQQILIFIFLWVIAVNYAGMNQWGALALYGGMTVLLAVIARSREAQIISLVVGIIALSPLLIKALNGELSTKIEERSALVKERNAAKEGVRRHDSGYYSSLSVVL